MSLRRLSSLILVGLLAACASTASPDDARMANALCAQGKELLAAGKQAQARDIYESAVHRDAQSPRAWNGLGVTLELMGKNDEAKRAYQNALDLVPNDLTAINNLAHLYLQTGEPQAAISLLQPHADRVNASPTLRQNLEAARKALAAKQAITTETYASLGSYPTEGMAQGHIAKVRRLLDDDEVIYSVVPEVKIMGGTPMFAVKATGHTPQEICDQLNPQAIPCVTVGK